MTTVTVPALVDFEFGGHVYRRGEPVTVTPVIASVLARRREVSLTLWHEVPEPQPKRRRRRASTEPRRAYRRRDLVAQS